MDDQPFRRQNPSIGPLARLRKTPCELSFAGLAMTPNVKDSRYSRTRRPCLRRMVFELSRRSARIFKTDLRRSGRLRRDRSVARHPVRISLRAPYRADHRPRSHWLSAAQSSGRNFEVGSSRRRLLKTASGSRKNDRRNRRLSEQRLEAFRRRRCRPGCPSVHDDKGRAQIGRDNGDQLSCWAPSGTTGNAAGVSVCN